MTTSQEAEVTPSAASAQAAEVTRQQQPRRRMAGELQAPRHQEADPSQAPPGSGTERSVIGWASGARKAPRRTAEPTLDPIEAELASLSDADDALNVEIEDVERRMVGAVDAWRGKGLAGSVLLSVLADLADQRQKALDGQRVHGEVVGALMKLDVPKSSRKPTLRRSAQASQHRKRAAG